MTEKTRHKIGVKYATAIVGILLPLVYLSTTTKVLASSDADYGFTIDSDWQNCQQIGSTYQEVYAFETKSFYINICQKDNVYFYSGEPKQSDKLDSVASPGNSIFLPAHPLENNRGFQAENGNVSYVVVLPFSETNSNLKPPQEAILTIKRNGRLVSVESSLNKYCHQSEIAIAPTNIELNVDNSSQLATIPQQQDIGWNSSYGAGNMLPVEIFDSNSRFDFYRMDGKLHRLATCDR